MCTHEVTRGEYKDLTGTDLYYYFAYDKDGNEVTGDAARNNPVNWANWYEAVYYCNKRSLAENITPYYSVDGETDPGKWGTIPSQWDQSWNVACNTSANGYRLPTEAEWIHAAKGGENHTYSGSDTLNDAGWYQGNTSPSGTRTVMSKTGNGYGIFDMSGNVSEWCWDSAPGDVRVLHGGSYDSSESYCQIAVKDTYSPYMHNYRYGFRIVCAAEH